MVISGTSEIWPKHSTYMNGGNVKIHTFEPIFVPNFQTNDIQNFIDDVQDMMHDKYLEMKSSL